jgi:hypothetical protein
MVPLGSNLILSFPSLHFKEAKPDSHRVLLGVIMFLIQRISHRTEAIFSWTGMVRVGSLHLLVSEPTKMQRRPLSISTIHTSTLARSPARCYTFSLVFQIVLVLGVVIPVW